MTDPTTTVVAPGGGRSDDAGEVLTGWVLCHRCLTALYGNRLVRDAHVCSHCGHHRPLTARQRLVSLSDGGRFDLLPSDTVGEDPLGFVDTVAYTTRLARAREATGMDEAVLCARATIESSPVVLAVMDFRFLGGSLSVAVGDLITQAAEVALEERSPLVLVTSSGGARMQEGALALMQMAKTSAAMGCLDEAGILTVSVITDPTFGGVAASFATLGDVILAEPGARLGFAGRRVIEQTIGEALPAEFQTAEFLLTHGMIDRIVPRNRLRTELATLLRGARPTPSATASTPADDVDPLVRQPDRLVRSDPWAQVQQARAIGRPTALDYLALAFEDFQELHGDRLAADCEAIVGGTARLGGRAVMVVGHQKGHDAGELVRRNFGMPRPAGYRKAARLMRLADKLGLPVVTLIDTPGAYPGADAEAQGQAVAIAENLRLMAGLKVPVVAVVIGEGGSGGALGLAVANRVLMFSNSVYSVISPEGCASIIWKSADAAPAAAAALGLTAQALLEHGVIDGVIVEPEGGTEADPVAAADLLAAAVAHSLAELDPLSGDSVCDDRRRRFRQLGRAAPTAAEQPRPDADGHRPPHDRRPSRDGRHLSPESPTRARFRSA